LISRITRDSYNAERISRVIKDPTGVAIGHVVNLKQKYLIG